MKWVRLTGIVVAVDEYLGWRVYTLDDSSGMCIECTAVAPPSTTKVGFETASNQVSAASNSRSGNTNGKEVAKAASGTAKITPSVLEPQIPWDEMDVGLVVKVKGKVGEYRGVKKIEVIKIEILRSTDMEVRCWNEVLVFRRDILNVPWMISKEEEEKCRKNRERDLRRARKKKEGREESKEERRARKERERLEGQKREGRTREKEEAEMLPPPRPRRKLKYPPLAVIHNAAGRYDALGI